MRFKFSTRETEDRIWTKLLRSESRVLESLSGTAGGKKCIVTLNIKINTPHRNIAFIAAPNFTLMMQNAKLILVCIKSKALFVTLTITFF